MPDSQTGQNVWSLLQCGLLFTRKLLKKTKSTAKCNVIMIHPEGHIKVCKFNSKQHEYQGITKVTRIHCLGTINVCTKFWHLWPASGTRWSLEDHQSNSDSSSWHHGYLYQISWQSIHSLLRHLIQNQSRRPHGGTWGKVRVPSKPVGFLLSGSWMFSRQTHPIVIVAVQSGPKWWSVQLTVITIRKSILLTRRSTHKSALMQTKIFITYSQAFSFRVIYVFPF